MEPTFHPGEQALQQRTGVRPRMAEVGPRVIRPFMPDQHREFFAELPFLLAGTVDATGQPWASVLTGPPGFAHSPDPATLRIDAQPLPHDPITLDRGQAIGLLGIQPHTRRRNRMNGWVAVRDARGFSVTVGHSFGNCPKYIQPREAVHVPSPAPAAEVERFNGLDAAARAWIARADTFFIATAHPAAAASRDPAHGVDVSHRGGAAGFVQIVDEHTLLVPDYVGNSFFNTLGNLQLEPRCGLLMLDTERGGVLQLAARASLVWDGPQVAAVPGALRLLRLQVEHGIRRTYGLALRWR